MEQTRFLAGYPRLAERIQGGGFSPGSGGGAPGGGGGAPSGFDSVSNNLNGDGIRMAWEVGAGKSNMTMDTYRAIPRYGA